MSEYCNSIKINVNDVCRIDFIDNDQNELKTVARIAMNIETLKALRDGVTTVIEEHEAKVKKLLKSN